MHNSHTCVIASLCVEIVSASVSITHESSLTAPSPRLALWLEFYFELSMHKCLPAAHMLARCGSCRQGPVRLYYTHEAEAAGGIQFSQPFTLSTLTNCVALPSPAGSHPRLAVCTYTRHACMCAHNLVRVYASLCAAGRSAGPNRAARLCPKEPFPPQLLSLGA
uniref:Uncharacterized protein n=1 Tax=Dunaliella tertiolecta TaxID=3047 RepID=A0A7S3R6G8_DUNTE